MEQQNNIFFTVQQNSSTSNIWTAFIDLHNNQLRNQQKISYDNINKVNNNARFIISENYKYVYYSNKSSNENNHIFLSQWKQHTNYNEYQLTEGQQNNYDPIFGWKSNQIFYKSNRINGKGNIWFKDLNNNNKHQILTQDIQGQQWKPQIGQNSELFFTNNTNQDSQIWKLNLQRMRSQRLTFNQFPNWYPTYDQMHKNIIFVSRNSYSKRDHIFCMNRDGNKLLQITQLPGDSGDPFFIGKSCCSNLRGKIIFINNGQTGKYQLYIMDHNGDCINKISTNKFEGKDILSPSFGSIYKE